VLELDSLRSTRDDIRKAYRRLAKVRHPDAGGSAEDFRLLRRSYEQALIECTARRRGRSTRSSFRMEEDDFLDEILRDRSGRADPFFCEGAWDLSPWQKRRAIWICAGILAGFCLLVLISFLAAAG
jgi:hypothetical protein